MQVPLQANLRSYAKIKKMPLDPRELMYYCVALFHLLFWEITDATPNNTQFLIESHKEAPNETLLMIAA